MRHQARPDPLVNARTRTPTVAARLMSNLSNPKIAVFYFAFLPQVVRPEGTHSTFSAFILGLTFAGLTFLVWVFRTSGSVLVGLGVKLAFERRP